MLLRNRPIVESSPALLARGYAWLPDLWRRTGEPLVRVRLLGRHAVALRGPDAVRFFYDEDHIRRGPALPEPVLSTLFGHGAVHTLDGDAHRARKRLFVALLMDPDGIDRLVGHFRTAWDEAAASWGKRPSVVLFDEAAEVITRAVCRWAGVPLDDAGGGPLARDLIAMVDGFATAGPRHWRARAARRRREDRLAGVVEAVRDGAPGVSPDSALAAVARHRDADGRTLDPRVAAVEVLNVIRPAAAVAWFAAFAAHALHLWPEHRGPLAAGDAAYAEAFAQEVRRFYPFAPFTGGQAVRDLTWRGEPIPAGATVLLDLYGQDHDGSLWPRPYAFDPGRFLGREIDPDLLVPQGGGDPRTGHRCPGELITVALLKEFATGLARLRYEVPDQDLSISLRRIPARPRSGFVMAEVG
ncbi:cytochrome P450 [Spirillospora sp. NPDC029432]|uniref:cytochrome P450 n=1 Tax=Spirillospora sp. NPDC029432 TaxID=3154599 RepID=UPI00345735CA